MEKGESVLEPIEFLVYQQDTEPDLKHACFFNTLPTDFSEFPCNFGDEDLSILKNTKALDLLNMEK